MCRSDFLAFNMFGAYSTYLSLGDHALARQQAYLSLMGEKLDSEVITKIRHCANSGLVLGSEKFKAQVDNLVR
jgi:hypothetical protein